MALTQTEKEEMLEAIRAESQSIDELPRVTDLTGVNTLPAMRGGELVGVPVSALALPAQESARRADTAAAAALAAERRALAAAEAALAAAEKALAAAEQMKNNRPQAVASEEEMERMVATGEAEEGKFYYKLSD